MATPTLGWNTLEYPEGLAIRALGFLSDDHAQFDRFLVDRFLEGSGVPSMAFKQQPISEELTLAVFDFLVANETALQEFSRRTDVPPEATYEARRVFLATAQARSARAARTVIE